MAEIILITGGARSGKSRVAQELAEDRVGRRLFVATCTVTDSEMQHRIEQHQLDRQDGGWDTIEETVDLEELLNENQEYGVVLIDCLTLWVNNLLFTDSGNALDETAVAAKVKSILEACAVRTGTVIMVTNEVGQGIVPENVLARRYRDLVGRCNQVIGSVADKVILVTCGIPLAIKEKR